MRLGPQHPSSERVYNYATFDCTYRETAWFVKCFSGTATYQKEYFNGDLNVTPPDVQSATIVYGLQLNPLVIFDGIASHFPNRNWSLHTKNCKVHEIRRRHLWRASGTLWPVPRSRLLPHAIAWLHKLLETWRTELREMGFDMRWYGNTWEFTMFWWQNVEWASTRGLDCTHGGGRDWMWKYFLQATIDDARGWGECQHFYVHFFEVKKFQSPHVFEDLKNSNTLE